jgi:hypothetical protein
MADLKKPALAAAVSMLGLSLGVTGAAGQKQPAPQGNNQGILIGLDQPGSAQIKGEQIKGEGPASVQWKSPSSSQIKVDGAASSQIKSEQIKSTQLKSPASNQIKAPTSNQIKW